MMKSSYESLHNHTLISDGFLTHLELLAAAERQGVGVIGFTDHDILPDEKTWQELKSYTGPVRWTMGIELSFGFPKEIPDWRQHSIHVLGLFIDPNNAGIKEFCKHITAGRLSRMKRGVAHLHSLGFDITEADCLAAAGASQLGQPHIVAALLAKPENVALLEKIKAEMRQAAEHDLVIKRTYDNMIKQGARQEPYTLVMGSKSFRALPKQDFMNMLDFDSGIGLIREAGGVAIIAHPYVYFDDMLPEMMESLVKDGRVDGLEVECVNTFGAAEQCAEGSRQLREIADRTNCLAISSGDAHDEADLKTFAASEAGHQSVGQTQRLVDHSNPNLSWSQLG